MKDYYEILEVNPKASREVIEKAYRVLVKKYHPDARNTGKNSNGEILEINEAYKVLSDEFLRKQYDMEIEKELYIKNSLKREKDNINNNYINNRQVNSKSDRKEKKENSVGTLSDIVKLCKQLGENIGKIKKEKKGKITKKDILAIALTIVIVLILCVILWFIPLTNQFIRDLTVDNPMISWIWSQ